MTGVQRVLFRSRKIVVLVARRPTAMECVVMVVVVGSGPAEIAAYIKAALDMTNVAGKIRACGTLGACFLMVFNVTNHMSARLV